MTYERSAPSYLSSVVLHVLLVAVILFFTYVIEQDAPPPPKILELVAGAGDNYGAKAAPALGSPNGHQGSRFPTCPFPPRGRRRRSRRRPRRSRRRP